MFPMMIVLSAAKFCAILIGCILVGVVLSIPPRPKVRPVPFQALDTGLSPAVCETCYQTGKRSGARESAARIGELGEEHAKEVAGLKGELAARDKTIEVLKLADAERARLVDERGEVRESGFRAGYEAAVDEFDRQARTFERELAPGNQIDPRMASFAEGQRFAVGCFRNTLAVMGRPS